MFHYKDCGLDNVWLKNGFNEIETEYGPAISIFNLEGLHSTIGMQIIECNALLNGKEIRFLRKEMDLSQKHLGEILGVSEESIRGWEKGRNKITAPSDKLIRILYKEHETGDGMIRDALERLSQMNVEDHCRKIELESTDQGWKTAA